MRGILTPESPADATERHGDPRAYEQRLDVDWSLTEEEQEAVAALKQARDCRCPCHREHAA